MCGRLGFDVIDSLDRDDKVANGFMVVLDVTLGPTRGLACCARRDLIARSTALVVDRPVQTERQRQSDVERHADRHSEHQPVADGPHRGAQIPPATE